jgi:hypothetical protein
MSRNHPQKFDAKQLLNTNIRRPYLLIHPGASGFTFSVDCSDFDGPSAPAIFLFPLQLLPICMHAAALVYSPTSPALSSGCTSFVVSWPIVRRRHHAGCPFILKAQSVAWVHDTSKLRRIAEIQPAAVAQFRGVQTKLQIERRIARGRGRNPRAYLSTDPRGKSISPPACSSRRWYFTSGDAS